MPGSDREETPWGSANTDVHDLITSRLDAVARQSPDLEYAARLYSAIIPVLREEEVPNPSAVLTDEVVAIRREQSLPFLEGLDLEVDVEQVTGLLKRLAAAAEKTGARVSAEKISLWLKEGQGGDIGAAFQALLNRDNDLIRNSLDRIGLDDELCRFLAQTAMKPVLRSWCRRLTALSAGSKWEGDVCFVCGSAALLAELQGNDQERHLRCGSCGADWRVTRLSCPHCGNEDHRALRVLLQENDPLRPRIEACDRCMTYLKVIPAFSPTPVDLLPVEDLATLRLDAAAREMGYHRTTDKS